MIAAGRESSGSALPDGLRPTATIEPPIHFDQPMRDAWVSAGNTPTNTLRFRLNYGRPIHFGARFS